MKIIGLTGGIAVGKSAVSQILKQHGYEIIDADRVAHQLQAANTPLLTELATVFGLTILHKDGSLNRDKLAKIVFKDEQARQRLNAIVHPAIRAEFERLIKHFTGDILFLDVPLLFEAGFDELTDANLVIKATKDVQLKRLTSRDGLTEEMALARINSQIPASEAEKLADFVIDNSGDFGALEENVEKFLEKIRK